MIPLDSRTVEHHLLIGWRLGRVGLRRMIKAHIFGREFKSRSRQLPSLTFFGSFLAGASRSARFWDLPGVYDRCGRGWKARVLVRAGLRKDGSAFVCFRSAASMCLTWGGCARALALNCIDACLYSVPCRPWCGRSDRRLAPLHPQMPIVKQPKEGKRESATQNTNPKPAPRPWFDFLLSLVDTFAFPPFLAATHTL